MLEIKTVQVELGEPQHRLTESQIIPKIVKFKQ